jgi:hypothetical protein
MAIGSLIGSLVAAASMGVAAWFGTNFFAKPVLALREKRLEALQIGVRYANVNHTSSNGLRDRALKALHDTANALRALSRERSFAVRVWCRLFKYNLEAASLCLFGLAEGPRGEYLVSSERQKLTLDALFVSLGATHHLSPAEVRAAKDAIEKAFTTEAA